MTPKLCLLAALLVALRPLPAGAASSLIRGTPLRVYVARPGSSYERFEGRLVSTGDTLALRIPLDEQETSDTLRIAVAGISRAEMIDGKEPADMMDAIVAGVLVAGIAFVATGYWALSESEYTNLSNNQVMGLVVGVPVVCGVLGGWLVARQSARTAPPLWREIPTSWLREP